MLRQINVKVGQIAIFTILMQAKELISTTGMQSPHSLQWLPPPSTLSIMPTSLPFSYNFLNSTTGPVASFLFWKHVSYSAIKDNEIMPFATTRMDLEIIIISKPNEDKYDITYMWNPKKKNWHKWTYAQNRNKSTDVENKHDYQRGKGRKG